MLNFRNVTRAVQQSSPAVLLVNGHIKLLSDMEHHLEIAAWCLQKELMNLSTPPSCNYKTFMKFKPHRKKAGI